MNAALIARLIPALIAVESQGDVAVPVGTHGEVGILQIRSCVIRDVNRHTGGQYVDADRADPKRSIQICQAYLGYWGRRYEKRTGKAATTKVLAQIWNGGPYGYRMPETRRYAARVMRVARGWQALLRQQFMT